MSDMAAVIVPKSDQINADDLIAGPRTFTIESVEVRPGTEQPVNIRLVGEDRAWRPCKSMSRVLVAAWGADSSAYRGKSLTLYRDPKVKWGGMEIGGIRVSHMSHIEREMLLQLTATKGKRAPHIVKPLQSAPKLAEVHQHPAAQDPSPRQKAETWASEHIECLKAAFDQEEVERLRAKGKSALAKLQKQHPDLYARVIEADPQSAIQPAADTSDAGNQGEDRAEASAELTDN